MIPELFTHPIFKLFLEEIEALGFAVSATPKAGFIPYGIIGGRSNARWWLIPLNNRQVATSGLALFQPIISSAKLLKKSATLFNALGLSTLWARNRVYISCPPVFSDLFGGKSLSYAFFTGTDSPHRKTAIQIMDTNGKIKGFAKISKQKTVKELINHESDCLEYAHSLNLKSAHVPRILMNSEISGARTLVTDTKKTRRSKSPVEFTKYHKAFLTEYSVISNSGGQLTDSHFLSNIRQQFNLITDSLSGDWSNRLEAAIHEIDSKAAGMSAPMSSCHGDFTPWNTFLAGDKLYVFDWEYARHNSSPGYDLIHFQLSLPYIKLQPAHQAIASIKKTMLETNITNDSMSAEVLLLCYLCGHSIEYIVRENHKSFETISDWDGKKEVEGIFDAIIGNC